MANGFKSGVHDSGSVPDLKGAGKVDRHEKSHDVEFAKGGDTHMFGEQAAGEQKAGVTEHDVSGGAPGPTFAKGGSTKMFGFCASEPARSGITSAR